MALILGQGQTTVPHHYQFLNQFEILSSFRSSSRSAGNQMFCLCISKSTVAIYRKGMADILQLFVSNSLKIFLKKCVYWAKIFSQLGRPNPLIPAIFNPLTTDLVCAIKYMSVQLLILSFQRRYNSLIKRTLCVLDAQAHFLRKSFNEFDTNHCRESSIPNIFICDDMLR